MSFLNRFLDGKPQDDTLASVMRNLSYIFNSKTGYGSSLHDFGLANYHGLPGARATADAVMSEMLRDIARFEPRLRPLSMRALDDRALPLAFELKAELRRDLGPPLAPKYETVPCRLAILFDPALGEVAIYPIEAQRVR